MNISNLIFLTEKTIDSSWYPCFIDKDGKGYGHNSQAFDHETTLEKEFQIDKTDIRSGIFYETMIKNKLIRIVNYSDSPHSLLFECKGFLPNRKQLEELEKLTYQFFKNDRRTKESYKQLDFVIVPDISDESKTILKEYTSLVDALNGINKIRSVV